MASQPYLQGHVTCLSAPATWLSGVDGQLRAGADGLYVADRRVLSRLVVTVNGREAVPVRASSRTAAEALFVGVLPDLGDGGADPTVWLERTRRATPTGGTETLVLRNASRGTVEVHVDVAAAADLASVSAVKNGFSGTHEPPSPGRGRWEWSTADGLRSTLSTSDGQLGWTVSVEPGTRWTVELTIAAEPPRTPGYRPVAPERPASWHSAPLAVRADDRRLDALVDAGIGDLDALRLADPEERADVYPAAGSPWYLTLFARDALWTALLALPLGGELAAGTLRALARRQGTGVVPETEEAPGKIPHELRPPDAVTFLPPVYYGTVDATPLFVVLLARAYRWGMPPDEVAALLPAAERALEWLASYGDPDGDGFVEYVPHGTGLANQGWKDSGDGVQHADGRLAAPPIALAEVQAYAYEAACEGAYLLDAFGRPGGAHWRDWADGLAARFRSAFWLSDVDGPYPAIALEAGKSAVDGPASNMGHLVGTGLLDPAEEAHIARRLTGSAMNSGYGLRTLAATASGFNPLSYHAGSVWPHDTAIAVLGLARAGHAAAAVPLLMGLLDAAPAFAFRLPELFGGFGAADGLPVPYPAACRPQAWTAAVGPALVQALLGLDVDLPGGRITLRPMSPSPVGAYAVDNIRLGTAGMLAVRVDADGGVIGVEAPPGVLVAVEAVAAPPAIRAPRPRPADDDRGPRVPGRTG